jgi:hypothetical protein
MAPQRVRSEIVFVKTKQNQECHAPSAPQPVERDPFYGHSEWVDAEMKRVTAQEHRRSSQHGGKTIKRPEYVTRTMGA